MDLAAAVNSPDKTAVAVKGKIVNVSPADTRSTGDKVIDYQEVTLKDSTGSSTLAVWGDMVNQFEKGSLVKFPRCRVRLFNKSKRLTTVPGSTYEMMNADDDLNDVSSDEDLSDVVDTTTSGTIVAILEFDPYLSCPNRACNNKKLSTIKDDKFVMLCPTCKKKYGASACNNYARATVFFNQGDQSKKVSLFKPEIQKIFQAKYSEPTIGWEKPTLFKKFLELLPLQVTCNIENSTMRNITVKRAATNCS
ncbi:uncharacterized protein [Argopecten irradians]|uniref:uncharacterized protein n=1 Tax=Argopecten irradians TaxID=31199 RepID=UPI00372326F1